MYEESKKELVRICHLLYDKNLVTAADGNVSVRVSKDHILLTPSGKGKGFVEEKDILVLDLEGNLVEGSGKPSREYPMHRAVYEERPEVGAVVHTHPVFATAFAMAGKTVPDCYLIETKVALKGIALAGFAAPGSLALAEQVRAVAAGNDAVLLQNHGALTVGNTLTRAMFTMEEVEFNANIMKLAMDLGRIEEIPADQMAKLMDLRVKMGFPGKHPGYKTEAERAAADPRSTLNTMK